MTNTHLALLATTIAGISTGLGALPIFLKKEFSKSLMDIGMGFSAGIMLVASFVSLILPGLEHGRNVFGENLGLLVVVLGIFLGYLSIILIHDLLPHEHLFKKNDMGHSNKFKRVTLIIFAITLHNFPEGLAVGVGFGNDNFQNGLLISGAIALQNMPEGLIVALGLLSEGSSRTKAFLMALCSGLVEPIAAGLGFMSTQLTNSSLPIALGFAGGAMLFVICQEMLPELFRQGQEKKATFGIITGITLMLILDYKF